MPETRAVFTRLINVTTYIMIMRFRNESAAGVEHESYKISIYALIVQLRSRTVFGVLATRDAKLNEIPPSSVVQDNAGRQRYTNK